MKKRISSAPILCSLLWALPGIVALAPIARAQDAAPASPPTAFITAVQGDNFTLSVGSANGARVGDIYQIARDNRLARLQITATRPGNSTAQLVVVETGGQSLLITVGDTASFVEAAPAQTVPVAPPPTGAMQPLAPETPAVTPPDGNAATPPAQVLVTAIGGDAGKDVRLGAGLASGIVPGAVYVMPVGGAEKARMIVIEVNADNARARLLRVADDFVPTVGESARFSGIEAIPASAMPVAIEAPIETPALPTPPALTTPSATLLSTQPGALEGSTALVTNVDGDSVTLGFGSARGAFVGQNLPILRNGAIIGLVRVASVLPNSASATVVYSDAALGPIAVGDAAGVITQTTGPRPAVTLPALGIPNQPIPSVRVKYESGASNVFVPKADSTYELLASLAARGLIKSQPARVFQDDGARRHRVAEDFVFSQAQIAGFVAEALSNFNGEEGRESAALAILVKNYRRDLASLNVPKETLDAFGKQGFTLGVSGWTRLRAVGGDNENNSRDAFDERFGGNRRKSGLDSRTNVFGTITPKLSFYASLDAGSGVRNGEPFGEIASSSFRKAYISYDASSILRGLSFKLGRQEYWLGPGHFGTGLLSDASGGLDSLSMSFKRGSYELRSVYARLGTGPAGGSRSLYVQDLNVKLGQSAKVGVNTAVLLPRNSFQPVLFATAFTPFPLYVARARLRGESNPETNNNVVVSGYGEVSVARGVRLYGELIIDDIATTRRSSFENRDGSIFGVELKDPKDPTRAGFNFEYGRFNAASYLSLPGRGLGPDYSYYYRGAPLGYSVAPVDPVAVGGSENIRIEGYLRPLKKLTMFAGIQFSDLNAQDQAAPGLRGSSRQRSYRLSAAYDINRNFVVTARAQRVDTDRPDFNKTGPTFREYLYSLELGRSF